MIHTLINGFANGLLLSLMAIGFKLVFDVTKVFHLAQGAIYVLGAYAFYLFFPYFGFFWSFLLSSIVIFFIGLIVESSVYKPLYKSSANQDITLISSLGIYIIIVNILSLLFGSETKNINFAIKSKFLDLLGLTNSQVIILSVSTPIIIIFLFFLNYTNIGLKIKAFSDNTLLSSILGFNLQKIRYLIFGLSSVLATVASILKIVDTGIDPFSGMSMILSATVVVILSGNYSLTLIVFVAIIFAITQNYIEYFTNSIWKETITYLFLIFVLLWKTEGIVKFKVRLDEK